MTLNSREEFSGNNDHTKLKGETNLFRTDSLPQHPIGEGYNKIIESEQPKPINHLFYDFSDREFISLLIFTDTHLGSISSHFGAICNGLLVAKYNPFIFTGFNGDIRNNAINTDECASSPLDNALSPTMEFKLLYEMYQDPFIKAKTLFINSGNHDNGNRTKVIGTDILGTFLAGTEYFKRYARFATVMTIRLKANNKEGYKDVVIYAEHGTSLIGGDGTKLDKGMKLARKFGANIAIFGHVHQDIQADYRIKKQLPSGEINYDDLSVVILPAPMGSEAYALDKRLETAPNELKLINIGTMPNPYLTDSTQKERRSLDKTSVYCDVTPIPNKVWEAANRQSQLFRNKYNELKKKVNVNNDKKIGMLIDEYIK